MRKNVGNPKQIWKVLKFQALQSTITPVSQISLKDGEKNDDEKANNTSFNKFYTNFTLNLVNELPFVPKKFNLDSVLFYYKRFLNTEIKKRTFLPPSKGEVLNLLKDNKPEKASGIDNLPGRFLKDSKNVLTLPISRL